MPKYIDAEQVDSIIGNAYQECMTASLQPENQTQKHVAIGLNYALNLIHDKVPAVNVDEVPHGKWIQTHLCNECSICKAGWVGFPETNYCPNCGARMETT